MTDSSHILLISCPDEIGLVHKITGVLYQHRLNVLSNGEFVDPEINQFFMRTELAGPLDKEEVLDQLRCLLPGDAFIQLRRRRKKSVVLLATREPHCLGDLLLRHACGELNASILGVISNHPLLEPLVRKFDLPYHCLPHDGRTHAEHETAILRLLDSYAPEYIVLAKYMRILTRSFTGAYPNRIINIHHSFLPAFVGASPYKQAYQRGVKIIGATAHFVTDNLDEGPIIAQSVLPVDHTQNARDMTQSGRDIEKVVLAKALKLAFEDRIFVSKNKTIIFEN